MIAATAGANMSKGAWLTPRVGVGSAPCGERMHCLGITGIQNAQAIPYASNIDDHHSQGARWFGVG
jgi:hypothetical protein